MMKNGKNMGLRDQPNDDINDKGGTGGCHILTIGDRGVSQLLTIRNIVDIICEQSLIIKNMIGRKGLIARN